MDLLIAILKQTFAKGICGILVFLMIKWTKCRFSLR